jgi:hypothetical protein
MSNPTPQPQPVRNDRGAPRQLIHPGYIKAAQTKLAFPTEIYAYPAFMRAIGPRLRPLTVPTPIELPTPAPSQTWRPVAFGIALFALWVVGANVTPGA